MELKKVRAKFFMSYRCHRGKIAKTKKNWSWPNIAIAKKIIFLA